MTHIMEVWRQDGVPANVPLFITESNISWQSSEAFVDVWGALWLADYIGAFLSGGGDAVYYFHYLPLGIGRGHNGSMGTFDMFSADKDLKIIQPLSQYFASQLINLEWVQPGDGAHRVFPGGERRTRWRGARARYSVRGAAAGRAVVADGGEQGSGERVRDVGFRLTMRGRTRQDFLAGLISVTSFGKEQYQWHASAEGRNRGPGWPGGEVDSNRKRRDKV